MTGEKPHSLHYQSDGALVPVASVSPELAWSGELLEPAELAAIALDADQARAEADPSGVYLGRLGASSRRTMGEALDKMARLLSAGVCSRRSFPWGRVRYAHAEKLRMLLVEEYAPPTVNKMLAAFRGVLEAAWKLGIIDGENYQRASSVKNVEGSRLSAGQPMNAGELAALFAACDDGTPLGRRDAAVFALLRQTGGRRFEVAGLELQHYNPTSGRLEFRTMKRQAQRVDHVSGGGKALVDAWIAVRGSAPGALLCPVTPHGRVVIRHLSVSSVWEACRRRAAIAGVASFHPHDFRHTVATDLAAMNVDIRTIQEKLGHRQLNTTQRYVHPTAEAVRRATEMLVVPRRGQ